MENVLKLAVFAKKRTTKEGKVFYSYLATLRKKTGEEEVAQIKFRDVCGNPDPEKCPINLIIPRGKANLSTREFVREDTGEIVEQKVLWVSEWTEGEPYVDTSLDEYM